MSKLSNRWDQKKPLIRRDDVGSRVVVQVTVEGGGGLKTNEPIHQELLGPRLSRGRPGRRRNPRDNLGPKSS